MGPNTKTNDGIQFNNKAGRVTVSYDRISQYNIPVVSTALQYSKLDQTKWKGNREQIQV